MADSTTTSESDLTTTSDSEASETEEQSGKSKQLDAKLKRSIEAASRNQLRKAIITLCKEMPDAAATLQPLLPSLNIAPPRRQFQAVRGHKPKLGMAPKRQLATMAARKGAPSVNFASSSSDDDTDGGRERKKRKIERACIHCEGDAEDPEGCCKDMRKERRKIDKIRDFLANC